MHPLDEKYWSNKKYRRWWGYVCPNDPRIIVSKRARWAGYTMHFAHKLALPVLATISVLILLPIATGIIMAPWNNALALNGDWSHHRSYDHFLP